MRKQLQQLVKAALQACFDEGALSSGQFPAIIIEKPAHEEHGDFATNVAMSLARIEKKPPRAIAEALAGRLRGMSDVFERIEIAGPGFINFTMKNKAWQSTLFEIASAGSDYGRSRTGEGKKVQVEFVSANPTGPLHIGHGRGAA